MRGPIRSDLCVVLGVLGATLFAQAAFASPALFHGIVEGQSAYRDWCAPGGFFLGADSPTPCPTSVFASANASVRTGTGGFTVPAGQFTIPPSSFTATFPRYPYFAGTGSITNQTGSFKAGYFPKGGMTTLIVNMTAPPLFPAIPRFAVFKVTYGPNGLGGRMPVTLNDAYVGTVIVTFPTGYMFAVTAQRLHGQAKSWNPSVGIGVLTHKSTSLQTTTYHPGGTPTTLMAGQLWASTRLPFFTGTVQVRAP